ncbi:ribonuclease P protein component [Desulfobacca acetoxidans]|uniref:Ribonuclease P protein component n=1 Tax=Desulfobacca acetoxidans (strain ATCC 700848 / DSM 11109 / ASRB2) TaxID=880072 RepID=F2NGV9_DESAR|nr:ribonuclease P protein component [Desulfobacca acetoxidans]AEB08730.1 Ribonuclease P protein component [Desulfobacca acetoxidans DSM 11109]
MTTQSLRGQASFCKADRLLKRAEFQRVKQVGSRRRSPHFVISLADNDLQRPRLGVVVTKRLGKAVQRNRVKRLLREFFRRHKGILPPQDIVIIAKPGAPGLTSAEVAAELGPVLLLSGVKDEIGS